MRAEADHAEALDLAARYAAWAAHSEEGRRIHADGVLFKVPHKVDPDHLVPVESVDVDGLRALCFSEPRLRRREGFALTDAGTDITGALDQANYCIWCHNQGKDSCSKGLREKTGAFKKNPFGVVLAGCPLEEKISDSTRSRPRATRSAPLPWSQSTIRWCAATGHRICNDCMKSCIYQKQDPVDIPQVETRILKDVLALPWGFEIYSLLTRWNPLEPAPAAAAAGERPQCPGRRPRPGRLHARPPPDERRPRGGGDRRPEDRAAAGRDFRHRSAAAPAARSARSATSRSCASRSATG